MTAWYNEIDRQKAAWLRELIKRGLIAPGEVDERSIEDVRPDELVGFAQYHFCAGIGGWSYALRLARWSDDRPAWTGSLPCQPFSSAGKRAGFADERHLWPAWFHLISQCRPPVLFGEQVASRDGIAWLNLVQTDLEGLGYAVGALDLPAACVGAPHRRQRLWIVGIATGSGLEGCRVPNPQDGRQGGFCGEDGSTVAPSDDGGMEHPKGYRRNERRAEPGGRSPIGGCGPGELADAEHTSTPRLPAVGRETTRTKGRVRDATSGHGGPTNGFWASAEWLPCRDGKARPTQPGISPLAHGVPARVVRLRGYGDAIVAPLAAEVVKATMAHLDTCGG